MVHRKIVSYALPAVLTGIILLVSTLDSCRKIPEGFLHITTDSIETLSGRSYRLNGTVMNIGEEDITQHGFCWSETRNPTTSDHSTQLGAIASKGRFSSVISDLSAGTTYYVRAYVITGEATDYGKEKSFTSAPPDPPSVTTTGVSSVDRTSAQSGGTVTDDGGAPVTARGVCWSKSPNPTISDNHSENGSGVGSFASSISGLTCGTPYFVRAYATNSAGTGYGSQEEFNTQSCAANNPPVADFTADRTSITEGQSIQFTDLSTNTPTSWSWNFGDGGTSAAKNPSHIYSSAGSYTVTLSATNSYGSDSETKTDYINVAVAGSPPVADFTASPTSITAGQSVQFTDQSTNGPTSWSWDFGDGGTGTSQNPSHTYSTAGTYTVELTATNSHGSDSETKTDYISVAAAGNAPVAEFSASRTSISAGESINFTDLSTNDPTSWEWVFGNGDTGTVQNPTNVYYNTPGSYTVSLTVTNGYGSDTETKTDYITVTGTTVTDKDGNTYNTVTIGSQVWMAENLKVTHYADGSGIPNVTGGSSWDLLSVSDKAYCWYNNSTTNRDTYGGLYNWAAAMNGASSSSANPSGIQGVCPDGWHLPSDAEWTQLTNYLGGESVAGGKMKETGTAHWNSPNTGATNTSGFTALAGGNRYYSGSFDGLGVGAIFWSATQYSGTHAWVLGLNVNTAESYRYEDLKRSGFSVRCVKD